MSMLVSWLRRNTFYFSLSNTVPQFSFLFLECSDHWKANKSRLPHAACVLINQRIRGADLSSVVVGRSFTVAKGFVPLKQEGEEGCKQTNYRRILLPGAANVSSPFFHAEFGRPLTPTHPTRLLLNNTHIYLISLLMMMVMMDLGMRNMGFTWETVDSQVAHEVIMSEKEFVSVKMDLEKKEIKPSLNKRWYLDIRCWFMLLILEGRHWAKVDRASETMTGCR